MSQTVELHIPHNLLSTEGESHFNWHGQLATYPTSATRYSPEGESSRYTPGFGSHKQEISVEGKLCLLISQGVSNVAIEKQKISPDTERHTV